MWWGVGRREDGCSGAYEGNTYCGGFYEAKRVD